MNDFDFEFNELDFEEEIGSKPKEEKKVPKVSTETEEDFTEDEGIEENDGNNENENEEDDDDLELPDVGEITGKNKKGKGKGASSASSSASKVPEKKKYEGPRRVKVYGEDIFTETDPNVSEEDIRKRIVEDFHYPEFSKDRTVFSLDEETGILCVGVRFEKKG